MVSIIIPTFRRPSSVVSNTIRSILKDSVSVSLISEIILIDQNNPPLEIDADLIKFNYFKSNAELLDVNGVPLIIKFLHITGFPPSVTKAKNFGEKFARGSFYVFFDDDVTVLPGTINNYYEILSKNPEITYLGGREILDSSVPKEKIYKTIFRRMMQSSDVSESIYQFNGFYVGRIKPNSFMIKNFNIEADRLINIDGARGCNWACRAKSFKLAGGFDEYYQGTALREETDLYLRLNKLSGASYYTSDSAVIHHRQLGGCDNLSDSLRSLQSKLDNEFYFQKKNFSNISPIFFLIRLFPLILENFKDSRGLSLYFAIKYFIKLLLS
jgi:GT2 family glycosyltransferase